MIKVTVSKQDGADISIDGTVKELASDTLVAICGVYAALNDSGRGAFKAIVTAFVTMEDSPVWQMPDGVRTIQEEGDGA